MLGVNISSSVKNKPLQGVWFPRRDRYAPFGVHDPGLVVQFLVRHQITLVRQILCVDEALCAGALRTDYLREYTSISRLLTEHGVRVILDFHQDIFSRNLGGCGLPQELLEKELQPVRLPDGGRMWGIVPLYSALQRRAWTDFFSADSD